MASKTNEINCFEEKDTNWFDTKDLEKYKGRSKWLKKYKPLIYSSLSCGFLTMAALEIWQGLSLLMFLSFFVATILSIVIDSRSN